MTKWRLVNLWNMLLTIIPCITFDVAICQLPDTPTYRSVIFKNIGIKLCQNKCIQSGLCRTLEYTIPTLTCHLSEVDLETITNETQYIIGAKDLADVLADTCQLKTCPNMRCLQTRTGKTECVKESTRNLTQAYTELNTTLLDACMVGDVSRVKFILSNGRANINSRGKNNMTPVMHAARRGHEEMFGLLVREGAQLSFFSSAHENILHLACIGGNVEIVKYVLIQNIVGINSRDGEMLTPAMNAAVYKREDVFYSLVEEGADLLLENEYGENILHVACEGGSIKIVRYLIEQDIVDIDSRDINGWTPVMGAVNGGYKDVFDFLVEAGADLSPVSNNKENILHASCEGGKVEIVKYLMKHDIVDIDSRDNNGWTPVMRAVSARHKDVFDILVEAGADLSLVGNKKETILHVACKKENVEIVKYLLTHEIVDINCQDLNGGTPVMHAVNAGHKDVFDVLAEAGADLCRVNDDGKTVLHLASIVGNVEIIKYLLKHEIVVIDSRDVDGWTPVMYAVNAGHKDVFDVFVEAGADLSLANNDKEAILHLASIVGNVEIIKHVLSHVNVDVDSLDVDGWTPVMRAAEAGHIDVFKVLVEKGADLFKVGSEKETILHAASIGENVEIIKYLLKHDIVDIDSRDDDGLTPVMHAATDASTEVFEILLKWGADLSLLDGDDDNILHLACYGDVKIVRYILSHNIVDINSRDGVDCTPAMIAARTGHEAIFFLLVDHGADLTIRNDLGDDILNQACQGENAHIVKYVSTQHIVEGSYREDDPCSMLSL